MGFDNECIVNIQSLPGEYFCPVCRTLIYPSEALQSQCTHLYCKPCLSYIAATTHACPYDGYLVTEADSKPLTESNKALGETIGKVAVNCLYQRSGCQWQGTLSECIAHCSSCTFGNSPVVCNRCGTQIIHRQVQEHTQICPGLQPQAQQLDNSQAQASATSSQTVSQDPTNTSAAAPGSTVGTATVVIPAAASASTPTAPSAAAPASASAIPTTAVAAASQSQTQSNITAYAQAASQLPTQQWYQQQQLQHYQQYYQMYPGYDPYQQHYQNYAQYQQQAYPQYGQPQAQSQPAIQGQQQPSLYVQPQSQPQPQPQPQPQVHAQPIGQPQPHAQAAQTQQQQPLMPIQQALPQPQPQGQSQPGAQLIQMQVPQPTMPVQQPYTQILPQTNQPPQAQIAAQQFVQPTSIQYAQPQPPQQMQVPPHQQPLQPQQHTQSLPQQQPHPHAQPQARPTAVQQPPILPQMHPQQPSAHQQMQPQSIAQPQHPSSHPVTGHQSYQQPQSGAPPQRPMFVQSQQVLPQQPVQMPNQFPSQQPSQMPPPSGYMPMQVQQQPMLPLQRPAHPQQQPHLPVNQHGQQKHQYPPMHTQAQQQVFPSQQSHGHLLPGQQFPQTMVSSQQQLHPQGPQHIQHVSAQTHPHGPPAQGMTAHQTAMRPMTANTLPHQSIQQFPGGPGKPAQPALNQQSPNHSNLTRPGPSLTVTPESLKSHLSQPGGQAVSIPSSGPPNSGVIDKMGISVELTNELVANNADGRLQNEISPITDTKISHLESETDRKLGGDSKENDKQSEMSSMLPEEEGTEPAEHKYGDKKEVVDLIDGNQRPDISNDGNAGENQSTEAKPDEKAGVPSEVRGSNVSSDAGIHKHSSLAAELKESSGLTEGPHTGEFASKTKSQQLPAPERGHLQQPTLQNAAPSYEGSHFQTGYQDRSSSQLAWNGSISGTRQAGPLSGKEGYPTQQIPYGHPSNAAAATTRFSAPDRILPHHIPHPRASQDRRSQETLPYQIQVPGQNIASGQMRPPGQNFPEHLPLQGQPSVIQESFRSSTGQPYGGGYHSDAPYDSHPGPGVPPSGRLPGHVGFPQHGFPEQALAPQGQGQSHMSQPHAGVRLSQHPQLVPNSGAFNTSSLMPRGPPFHPEDRGGPSHLGPSNALEPEMYDTRRPGFSDVRPDILGKSNLIKANGIPGKMQVDSMHDPAFALGLSEDRFKPFPDERFRPLPEDGMPRHFPLDPGRHNAGRREFEEDLKQFPRPAHLDSEGVRNFDSYNSSRPLDRGWQQTGPDIRPFDRPFPRPDGIPGPFASGQTGSFPASRPVLENHMMDMLETRRPPGPHEEFDRHMDVLPPIRSPVRDYGALPSSRFGTTGKPRLGDIDSRELHGFTERSKPFNASSDLSAGSFHDSKISIPSMLGSGTMPGRFLRDIPDGPRSFQMEQFESGEPFNQGRMPTGDPGFGGVHGRDFSNEAAPFNIHNARGDMEPFELLKKRKPGTMGWCRICSIDCETVEGLDLHAQTREHQKMAMNMVLAIKREANMKNRISENVVPREGKNKRKDFGKPLK